jgi:hypothetical protein
VAWSNPEAKRAPGGGDLWLGWDMGDEAQTGGGSKLKHGEDRHGIFPVSGGNFSKSPGHGGAGARNGGDPLERPVTEGAS